MGNRIYAAIDLKSFYASVECMDRGLNPLTTNLVVADNSRTEKTICLAVSPSLKEYGISGRARLFEVVQRVKEINYERSKSVPHRKLCGESYNKTELETYPNKALTYITAVPRMALYMEISTKIYNVYLKYVAPEDIHTYSIDEVFIDITDYLNTYEMTPRELVMKMISEVFKETGITATGGIGTNLYLCKVAMDIVAKHISPDANGVRITELDEHKYRKLLWNYEPITDFWRVGRGYAKKLADKGIHTMGEIARCSLGKPGDFYNEDLLYKMFGVNAELLIDHAWGWEPCTMKDIKAYRPSTNSIGSGQVLHSPYNFTKAKLIAREMTESLVLDLVSKNMMTDQIVITVGYDIENLTNPKIKKLYHGEIKTDHFGRKIPKHAHGTANMGKFTSSTKLIVDKTMELFDKEVNEDLLVRRLNIAANHVMPEETARKKENGEQLSLFGKLERDTPQKQDAKSLSDTAEEIKDEKQIQKAMLDIKNKYGKNAILKGTNLEKGATMQDRNKQIGGHKA